MTEAETISAVDAVFTEAGWLPMGPGSSIAGKHCARSGPGWVVGGMHGKNAHVKVTWSCEDSDDTPDDPIEAARWLVASVTKAALETSDGAAVPSGPVAEAAGPVEAVKMPPYEFQREEHGGGVANLDPISDETKFSPEPNSLGQELLEWQDETGQDAGDEGNHDTAAIELPGNDDASDAGNTVGDDPSLQPVGVGAGDRPENGDHHAHAYSGIAIEKLSDELSIRRAQVIDRIFAYRDIRLDALMDPSRREALAQAFADYQNKGALGLPVTASEEQDYRAYQAWAAKETRLRQHADALCRSARDADLTMLKAMAEGIHEGWPSDG